MAEAFCHVSHYARREPGIAKRGFHFFISCVMILNMNEVEAIIAKHGGGQALAQKMGLPEKWLPQRLHNWKKNGIPASWKLKHPDLFLSEEYLLAALEKIRARTLAEQAESGRHE